MTNCSAILVGRATPGTCSLREANPPAKEFSRGAGLVPSYPSGTLRTGPKREILFLSPLKVKGLMSESEETDS